MLQRQNEIVIAGGGVAGLAVALALAKKGRRCTVLERTEEAAEVDRGDVIHEASLPFLRDCGLLEQMDRSGAINISEFQIVNQMGKQLFSCDLERDLKPPIRLTVLRHVILRKLLLDACHETSLVSHVGNALVTDLIVENGRIQGVQTGSSTVMAPLTILATGSTSLLRDKYFAVERRTDYAKAFLNVRCRIASPLGTKATYVLGTAGVMIILPLPGGEVRIGLQVLRNRPDLMQLGKVRQMISERLPSFPVDDLQILDAHVYALRMVLCQHFFVPGAVVIGDAAHATHPVGGQGMNMAFKDAAVLAVLLGSDSLSELEIDHRCELFDEHRRSEVRAILSRTHRFARLGDIEAPFFLGLREVLLQCIDRSQTFKEFIFRRIAECR